MILHKKNGRRPFGLFLVLIIIIFISLPLNIVNYRNITWDFYEKVSTFDTGASSLHELSGGTLRDYKGFFTLLKNSPKAINNVLFSVNRSKDIPSIYIDIKFKNYKKLIQDRDSALMNGIGYDYRNVKSEVTFNNKKMKSKVRLKGHLSDHWRSKYRMSLRVKLSDDNSLFGFKEFSLHKPSARQHPYDQTFQDIQRDLGNISSQHNYVNVHVNGENWGVMNIEEHLTKEFLEKQEIKESLIIEFGNEKHDIYKRTVENIYDEYRVSDPYLNVNVFRQKKYLNQNLYRKWLSYISQEHIKEKNELYDNDSFTKSLFLSMIWNNTHSLYNQNSRYYFNPYNYKLYPITTDQSFFTPIKEKLVIPKPYEKVLKSFLFEKRFDENHRIVKNELLNSQNIIDKWQDYFPLDNKISSNVLIENEKIIFKDFEAHIKKKDNKTPLVYNKITKAQSESLMDHVYAKHYDNGEIHIHNLTREKINIKNICIDGKELESFDTTFIEGHDPSNYNPLIIDTNMTGFYDNRIEIETELLQDNRVFKLGFSLLTKDIYNPLTNLTRLDKVEFLERIDENNYKIKRGIWNVKTPIVFNKNLLIENGTELIFNSESYFIIKGSLKILGKSNDKVILRSKDSYWKGIYVVDSEETSFVNNANISDVTYLRDGILDLSGGITFYNSNVEIKNTFFNNSNAEDFLNIVHSDFTLNNVKISNSSSDAFDSDFSKGTIQASFFSNIAGDGIDFSGSEVSITDTTFKNVRDKSISVGEKSSLTINNIDVDSVGVGVASKDGSTLKIRDSRFSNYNLNALMTYQKKSFYDKSSLIGENIIFDDKRDCCLRQSLSKMIINGDLIEEQEINIDLLYATEIMKK